MEKAETNTDKHTNDAPVHIPKKIVSTRFWPQRLVFLKSEAVMFALCSKLQDRSRLQLKSKLLGQQVKASVPTSSKFEVLAMHDAQHIFFKSSSVRFALYKRFLLFRSDASFVEPIDKE
jgi:hypothetical protein